VPTTVASTPPPASDGSVLLLFCRARILPSIVMVLLVGWQLVPRLHGEGPFWSTDASRFVGECDTQWLSTLLLSNNLSSSTRTHNMCLGHTWYLMVDLQLMFNLAPLLYNIHWKYGKGAGLVSAVVSLLVTVAVGIYVVCRDDISVSQMVRHYSPTPRSTAMDVCVDAGGAGSNQRAGVLDGVNPPSQALLGCVAHARPW
jgi:hypothetical protein